LKLPGVVDYAINLVEFDQKYRRAFEYVLSDTVVAENLEAVKGLDGVRWTATSSAREGRSPAGGAESGRGRRRRRRPDSTRPGGGSRFRS